jgi:putative ATPase
MTDLFDQSYQNEKERNAPLAERMRPKNFQEFFGQEEIVGEGSPLRKIIEEDNLSSLIFWGPPGSGKTTLARIIAQETNSFFVYFSAVATGINEVRKAIEAAEERLKFKKQKTILFLDEIHRFNKAQQDALLPYVEDGTIVLIGATTENPSFEIISPLLSRSSVFVLKPLEASALEKILLRAIRDKERGFGKRKLELPKDSREKLINFADGDARVALNALEFVIHNSGEKEIISPERISSLLQKHALRYDKGGEEHYNVISAFIKSLRDSDPDGALYWLARMIESGEDPRFIARRMFVFASEDIGNADPQALLIAAAVAQAVEYVGLPEAQINLAQGTTYLATAPKSNASYKALLEAKQDAQKGSFPVPLVLRNAVTSLMKKLGYGQDYQYSHDFPKQKIDQKHFPPEIGEKKYYRQPKIE